MLFPMFTRMKIQYRKIPPGVLKGIRSINIWTKIIAVTEKWLFFFFMNWRARRLRLYFKRRCFTSFFQYQVKRLFIILQNLRKWKKANYEMTELSHHNEHRVGLLRVTELSPSVRSTVERVTSLCFTTENKEI